MTVFWEVSAVARSMALSMIESGGLQQEFGVLMVAVRLRWQQSCSRGKGGAAWIAQQHGAATAIASTVESLDGI